MVSAVLQLKQGETFQSDTDTEVIPKLCKWIYHHLPSPMPFSEVCCAWALGSAART